METEKKKRKKRVRVRLPEFTMRDKKYNPDNGRPTLYEGEKTDQAVFEFASHYPVIDSQIAEFLGIQVSTLNNWKKMHPSFVESLKKAKDTIDNVIISSLFKRAKGFREKEAKVFCHEGMIISEEFEKVYPPDPTSMIFWLKNRRPDEWREKQDVEANTTSTIKIESEDLKL